MEREIKKKMVILNNRAPFDIHVKKYIEEMEETEWVYSNLRLDGSFLDRETVGEMLRGQVLLEGRIMDHILARRLADVREYMYMQLSGRRNIDMSLLLGIAEIISGSGGNTSGNREDILRKSTPQLVGYDYTPPLPVDIDRSLEQLIAYAGRKQEFVSPFAAAAYIHNKFLAIWPFRENNEFIGRAICQYRLMLEGYPMARFDISESGYSLLLMEYLKTDSSQGLEKLLVREIYNTLELMIQLTSY